MFLAMSKTAARRALEIAALREGSKSALARRFGISRQALDRWGDNIPPKRVAEIADLSGVPAHEIRPDVFPPPQTTAAG